MAAFLTSPRSARLDAEPVPPTERQQSCPGCRWAGQPSSGGPVPTPAHLVGRVEAEAGFPEAVRANFRAKCPEVYLVFVNRRLAFLLPAHIDNLPHLKSELGGRLRSLPRDFASASQR
jgi:hypothetical protein